MKRLAVILILIATLANFAFVLFGARSFVGKTFPGYLAFENGLVGAYFLPQWSGASGGLKYHDRADQVPKANASPSIFTEKDFRMTAILPAAVGLIFVMLGLAIALLEFPAFFFFHALVGNFLITSVDFHFAHYLSRLHLFLFALLPAVMVHLALSFPEKYRNRRLLLLPYGFMFFLLIPYEYFFRNAEVWIVFEYLVVGSAAAAYVFWVGRLLNVLRKPQFDFSRILAKHVLIGQLSAFIIPLLASIAIFGMGRNLPLNFAAPLILLFPLALFVGLITARFRQDQIRLVQAERMATLGTLMAGLAHELNNPMTFVSSNIEPLRERLETLRAAAPEAAREILGVVDDIEEGAERARKIIDEFRFFSHPGGTEAAKALVNLVDVLDHAVRLLTPKWKDRIEIVKNYEAENAKVHGTASDLGRVFVNLIANACEASPQGSSIEIRIRLKSAKVMVTIKDRGAGIPKNILARIFDPFFTTKAAGEGVGLGLPIASQIVKSHGGTIQASSELSLGTEFVVTLPLGDS